MAWDMVEDGFSEYLEMARSMLGGQEDPEDLWEANNYVNMALHLRPMDAEAWILKSQILSSIEDDFSALAAAEMGVRYAPHMAEAHYTHATVLADLERNEEALKSIELAFQTLSDEDDWLLEDLYFEKAAVLDILDREEEAISTFKAGLERFPHSALLQSGLEPLRRERIRRLFRVIEGGKDK